jgi:hypothetical protein
MKLPASVLADKLHGNKKRPPERRWRAAEGLTTRRRSLPMAGSHLMYVCPQTGDRLLHWKGLTDG